MQLHQFPNRRPSCQSLEQYILQLRLVRIILASSQNRQPLFPLVIGRNVNINIAHRGISVAKGNGGNVSKCRLLNGLYKV